MDDFLKKNDTIISHDTVSDVKKIEFKQIKEGRFFITYIYNLEYYIKDAKLLSVCISKLKKVMGTACSYKETQFGYAYGFNGDLIIKIKAWLTDNDVVAKTDFK